MGTKERFVEFLKYKEIGQTAFELSANLSRGSIAKKTGFSADSIEKIAISCPDLNLDWLITGKGEMLKPNTDIQVLDHPKLKEKTFDDQSVPLYDISAAANLKTLLVDKSQNIIGKISIPDMPKCDGAVYVRGDSMYPLLKSGDIIVYKEVCNFDYVVYGEMYLVSFDLDGDEYLSVKYVNRSDKEGCISLVSYNSHHHAMDVPIACIYAMAIVKASVRLNTMR